MLKFILTLSMLASNLHASCVRDLATDAYVYLRGGAHLFAEGRLPRSVRPVYDDPLTETDRELAGLAVREWADALNEVIVWEALDRRGVILARAFDVGRPFSVEDLAFYVPSWPAFAGMITELRGKEAGCDVGLVRCIHVHVVRTERYRRWPFASFSEVDLRLALQYRAVLTLAGLSGADFTFGVLEPTHDFGSTANQFVKTEFTLPATMRWDRRDYPLSPSKRAILRRARRGLAPLHAVFDVD